MTKVQKILLPFVCNVIYTLNVRKPSKSANIYRGLLFLFDRWCMTLKQTVTLQYLQILHISQSLEFSSTVLPAPSPYRLSHKYYLVTEKQHRERTLPSSLSSRLNKLEFSVTSLTLTIGNGMLVVKSPWVSQLHNQQPRCQSIKAGSHSTK